MVVIKKCPDYSRENVLKNVRDIFNKLGGIEKFIKPGMVVAVKPNMVARRKPEVAATTHPEVVYAVCALIKEAGAKAVIVESPGGLYNPSVLKGVYQTCGIAEAARDADAELNYDTSCTEVENPGGMLLKKVTILKPIAEADAVISICKLKTHGQMVLSAAVKNMFGAVPGLDKPEYHFRMPDYDDFANAIIDIFLSTKVTLSIVDGIIAMEGEGPTSGSPRPIGILMGSPDAFALDTAAAAIIGIKPNNVPVLRNAIKRGLCSGRTDDIELAGDSLDSVKAPDYDIPQLGNLRNLEFTNSKILRYFTRKIRPKPVFHHDKCAGCGDCARTCPAHIIELGSDKRPRADLSKCISCFCCQELCPVKAVSIKRPLFMRMALRKKK